MNFFLFCIVLHEFSTQKSSILDIYFLPKTRYNIRAVGGTNTTASRTAVTRSLRSINLMISARKRVHGCAFLIPFWGNGGIRQSAGAPDFHFLSKNLEQTLNN
jgi:hypothetical protein